MTKLVVEILDAGDLMPKDGDSANPFVEVDFDDQKQRTHTKHRDLNPYWNEKLLFNISHPKDFPNKTIDVVVYNERKSGHRRDFLGRVRISGMSVPLSEQEANIQRYPLDKRGLFSHIKGDIGFRMYIIHDDVDVSSSFSSPPPTHPAPPQPPHFETPLPLHRDSSGCGCGCGVGGSTTDRIQAATANGNPDGLRSSRSISGDTNAFATSKAKSRVRIGGDQPPIGSKIAVRLLRCE